ncbi:MAG: imidazole glycerol phosphate synthase subunit HisF [Deltaproteobacteria bacterium]|nr:imidazole glycerol phosphate synthase subunit HisF [Deltaproteobacteria bacterium]
MLKTRVIPTLLWKDYGLVKGKAFDSWRRIGSLLPAIRVYNTRDVDELIVVDITASREGHEIDFETVEEFAADCFVPLTVGGGLRHIDQVTKLLRSGADKVCLNSVCYESPQFVEESAKRFGSQCVVVSIDAKKTEQGYVCYSHSGSQIQNQSPVLWAKEMQERGAGEILLTSIDRDGLMEGFDLELIQEVCDAVSVPVIASGGAGNYDDFYKAVQAKASAVAGASLFHFTEQTPRQAKEYLSKKGVAVRQGAQ